MQPGIFAKTFPRAKFEDAFAAVKNLGLDCIQFNFSCAGLPTLPDSIEPGLASRIRTELKRQSLVMAAISGTCNLIHPDQAARAKDLARLKLLIQSCAELGTSVVTLCTGTRDAHNMWRPHPDNHSSGAWKDLVTSIDELLPCARERGVILGIEPEPANVIDSAAKARKLLDELKSPSLKIIFDAANLVQPNSLHRQREILSEVADLLGSDIVIAHAKDLSKDPLAGQVPAGQGALDYTRYISVLREVGFHGPIILHGLRENEAPAAVAFLRDHLGTLPMKLGS